MSRGAMGRDWQNELWRAINAYAVSCGAKPDFHIYGNSKRQETVARIERLVEHARAMSWKSGWYSGSGGEGLNDNPHQNMLFTFPDYGIAPATDMPGRYDCEAYEKDGEQR